MNLYCQGKALLDSGNIDEAMRAFIQGQEAGQIYCAYGLLAATAMGGGDCTAAIVQLRSVLPQLLRMADDGDVDACFIIGRCYETGCAAVPDIQEAMRYYTRAAAKGNLDAMFNLGCIYIRFGGSGALIVRDYFHAAAGQGHRYAQLALSHYYKEECNADLSTFWRKKAAQQ